MATIQFLEDDELGHGLEKGSDNHLTLKLDNSGNVTLTKSEAGLKAEVQLPDSVDLSTVNSAIESLQETVHELNTENSGFATKIHNLETSDTAEKAKVATLESKVEALEGRNDVKLQDAVLEGNTLKLTLTDSTEVNVDLAQFMNVVPTAQNLFEQMAELPNFKSKLLEVLKGEEVQNFSGETQGYLLAKA